MLRLNLYQPAVVWPGGKRRLLKHLLPKIPPHTCYVEAFAGGLAMLCAKTRSRVEVVNDLHDELIAFYRCVRFHPEALLAELRGALRSRREFRDYCAQPGLTDIQRSARWFLKNRTCFGAQMGHFGTSALSSPVAVSRFHEAVGRLSERLDRVTIESLDWRRCLEIYDRPSTFFFLDPPYTMGAVHNYDSWTTADVQEMRGSLDGLRGRWLVTLNDTEENRAAFDGCEVAAVERAVAIENRCGGGRRYRELIITPPEPRKMNVPQRSKA